MIELLTGVVYWEKSKTASQIKAQTTNHTTKALFLFIYLHIP